jgi:hypothetical protein
VASQAKSSGRVAAAWGLLVAAALAAAVMAVRFGYERSNAYTDGCADTSASRSLGRLTLWGSGVSLLFIVGAGLVLVGRSGPRLQRVATPIVFVVVLLLNIGAFVGGSMCVDFGPR